MGLLPRPCDGPDGHVGDSGSVQLVLTPSSAAATASASPGAASQPQVGSARVGDVVQVRLPATERWHQPTVAGGLTLLAPSAVLDVGLDVCFWNFKATASGDATLEFVGGALCAANEPCPLYAILQRFLVHIT
jgi:hypothetical protein